MKAIVEDFYLSREPRVYIPYAPTLRSDRLGLKVIEVTMSIQELDREIARVKAALAKTTSDHLKSDYGKYLRKLYRQRKRLKHES